MSFDNTQITSATGYNVSNIIYGKPRDGSIPNSTVSFKRIPIGTRNPDGTTGELILPTETLFSFGLQPSVNMTTGKTDGYTLALCLWNMDGATPQQKAWTDTFNAICNHVADHVLEHRDDIGKYELENADLKKLRTKSLFWKLDKGKIVEGTGPMLYAKVLQNKKNGNLAITSLFYDENGRDIDPMTLLNKQCHAKVAIKIEGIFIGSKISLQVKLHEAEIKMKDSGIKRLLRPALTSTTVTSSDMPSQAANATISTTDATGDEDDDTGSLKGDESEEEQERTPTPPPAPVKAPVRRMGKK
jgi:Protein of unknown function (DUF2738)